MAEKQVQNQIDEINRKLDLILEDISIQRQNREAVNDLVDDLAVVGKDAFRNMVTELDHAGVELDTEALRCLTIRLIRNIRSLGMVMETIESINDLAKDITPVIKQIGIDGVHKFHELENKGYFELFLQIGKTFDNLLSRYSMEEIKNLSENLIPVIDTIMILGDPKVLNKINSAVVSLRDISPEDIEEYSVWKMIRELNKPEVKRSIGFLMAFIKNTAKQ
ncbi:MAG TPA: DUF1641 domain-containing protein [Bacteroidales bacterium]|nr:DUF1641 domain-containing protein [Bacteroidales bacterium]HPJ58349.1 DUF1641 domain-containing protein [Bacteroidales bacterium]HPR10845.1 DUF1641 domain-containing protein [Bacteroidales bacterium]HRW84195.1 DUF1641 domain-containing protein [Bacteroidales bacterium]